MNKLILMIYTIIVCFGFIKEIRAECEIQKHYSTASCWPSVLDTSGNPATCGKGCSYTYHNGILTISADNINYDNPEINRGFFSKGHREGGQFTNESGEVISVDTILIDGFTRFAPSAFWHTDSDIAGKNGVLEIEGASNHAFASNTLKGNIIWKGNMQHALGWGVTIDGNLIIEDTAGVVNADGFDLGENGRVFCKTDLEKCKTLLTSAGASAKLIAAAETFPEGCEKINVDARCLKCKNSNFKLNDGECDRLRYTPAEAAEVLHNDNSNSVVITFKK